MYACSYCTALWVQQHHSTWFSMYRQLFGFALCVCFLVWLPGIIDCQALVKEMEVAEKKENQRKLEEGDEFEAINHEKDEELQEKGDAEKVEDLKVQVL